MTKNQDGSMEFLIEFLERKIKLPDNYEKFTIQEMFELSNQYGDHPEGYVKQQFTRLRNLESSGAKIEFFAEKDNMLNNVSFMLGEYLPLDKSLVHTYVNLLEGQVFKEADQFESEYKILESNFLQNKYIKAIKVKFEISSSDGKRYMTQYIITYQKKTFTMVVENRNNIDLESVLTNFPY